MAMSEGLDVMPTYSLNKGSGDGMFGGSGSWIFFLFFLLAWGGNGLGGFGGNNASNQITNDFLFSNLNNQLGRLSDQTAAGFTGVNQGLCSLGYETASNFKDMQAQMANCCCETNRNIDAVRYENAKNTCDIITAGDKNTDRIINYLTQNEIQTLRDQLQSANLALSNAAQTTNIVNSIRPIPQPAYITCSPYASTCGSCC
jgi:hypothetical protein